MVDSWGHFRPLQLICHIIAENEKKVPSGKSRPRQNAQDATTAQMPRTPEEDDTKKKAAEKLISAAERKKHFYGGDIMNQIK